MKSDDCKYASLFFIPLEDEKGGIEVTHFCLKMKAFMANEYCNKFCPHYEKEVRNETR